MKVRFVNAYVHRLHKAAAADPVLGAAFLRVINLIDPPTRLLAPGIAWRVLRGARRRPGTREPSAGQPLQRPRTRIESPAATTDARSVRSQRLY
jgi:hypothetical protein